MVSPFLVGDSARPGLETCKPEAVGGQTKKPCPAMPGQG